MKLDDALFPLHSKKHFPRLPIFSSLQHILKCLSVSVCALLFSAVRRTLAPRGPRSCFGFREMRDCVAERRPAETVAPDDADEI